MEKIHSVYGDDEVEVILNLTQHAASPEQVEAGVVEPEEKARVQELLTFASLPSLAEIYERAEALAEVASRHGATQVMIGGAPYLMAPLEWGLLKRGILPLYSFTERVSEEQVQPDGTTRKVSTFRHVGFVRVDDPDWIGDPEE